MSCANGNNNDDNKYCMCTMIFVKANKCMEIRTQLWMTNSTTETTKQCCSKCVCATLLYFENAMFIIICLRVIAIMLLFHSLWPHRTLPLPRFSWTWARVRYCIWFLLLQIDFFVCFHHHFFSHSLWTIVYWMRQMGKWYEFLFCELLIFVVVQSV